MTNAERLKKVRDDIAAVKARRDLVRTQMVAASTFIEGSRYKADLNQKASEVIKSWLEEMLRANVDSMADLVTTALRHIIHDQHLTFKIIQEPKYNRLAMRFVIEENGVEADPMAAFGGGPAVVASLVLRIAVMSRLKMSDLLLLDESMSALANKYVPAAADFMKQLSEETGINIFMVTHNEEFMSNASLAYEGYTEVSDDGLKSLRLKRRS